MDDQEYAPHEGILGQFGVPPAAERLWLMLMRNPAPSIDETVGHMKVAAAELDAIIQTLLKERFVQPSSTPLGVEAIDPKLAVGSQIARAQRELVEHLEALSAVQAVLPTISAEWARSRNAGADPPNFENVHGLENVRLQIYLAGEAAKSETRSLYHSMTVEGLQDAQPWDLDMAARGIRSRSIIGAAELDDPEIFAELERYHARGELFRTLPEVPTRLQIYDDDLAVLPIDPDDLSRGAMFLHSRILVRLLVLLFDHMWSVADPIFTTSTDPLAPTGRLLRTLELMAIGIKDERIARTQGVKTRTIGRDVAKLKKMLGVSSRVEIVAAAIRRGWI